MRDETHTPSTNATTPAPAAVKRNHESALRTSARSGVSGCVTCKRASTTSRGAPASVLINGNCSSPTAAGFIVSRVVAVVSGFRRTVEGSGPSRPLLPDRSTRRRSPDREPAAQGNPRQRRFRR
jgi:hypothetical protein